MYLLFVMLWKFGLSVATVCVSIQIIPNNTNTNHPTSRVIMHTEQILISGYKPWLEPSYIFSFMMYNKMWINANKLPSKVDTSTDIRLFYTRIFEKYFNEGLYDIHRINLSTYLWLSFAALLLCCYRCNNHIVWWILTT